MWDRGWEDMESTFGAVHGAAVSEDAHGDAVGWGKGVRAQREVLRSWSGSGSAHGWPG